MKLQQESATSLWGKASLFHPCSASRTFSTTIHKCTLSSPRRFNFSPSHHFSSPCSPFCSHHLFHLSSLRQLRHFSHSTNSIPPRRFTRVFLASPTKPHARAESASVYPGGGIYVRRVCFGSHDFHRGLLDSLRSAGDGDSESALPIPVRIGSSIALLH